MQRKRCVAQLRHGCSLSLSVLRTHDRYNPDKAIDLIDEACAKIRVQLESRPELLDKLITVLKDREMPPEDEPPLPAGKREQMVKRLQATLEQALKTHAFGPTPIRRMNRFQYNNAVVDLLELDRDGRSGGHQLLITWERKDPLSKSFVWN